MSDQVFQAEKVDSLLGQLSQAIDGLKTGKDEKDRVASIKAAQELIQTLERPQDAVTKLAFGPVQMMSVRIGIDLGIFTTLAQKNGPTPLEEIAATKNAEPLFTERILRVLARIGFVVEHDTRVYAPNELTRHMTNRGTSATVKYFFDVPMVTLAKTPEYFRKFGFQTPEEANKGPFQYAEKTEKSQWEWLEDHPDIMESCYDSFDGGMGGRPSWVDWFPVQERIIDGFKPDENDVLLIDVAGGKGNDLLLFLQRHPTAPGRLILEDLPHVVEGVKLDDRIEKKAFDLFKPHPISGARAYHMKFILHDWADGQCLQILEHLRTSMKKGYSTLLIEEFIVADKDAEMLHSIWDLEMLIYLSSMERSRNHWEKMLASAGFKIVKFWNPPGDGLGIIEAEVA